VKHPDSFAGKSEALRLEKRHLWGIEWHGYFDEED
jgi:hypothetical protein